MKSVSNILYMIRDAGNEELMLGMYTCDRYLKRLRVYNASVHASVTLKVCKRSKEWGYLRKNLNRYVTFVLEI